MNNNPALGAKYFQKVREQSRTASSSANFSSLKTFIENERESIVAEIDANEAEELKIAPIEARKKRARMVKRNKRLLADEAQIVLSDEQSGNEEDFGLDLLG